jgi:excisionase family DNA binding protein
MSTAATTDKSSSVVNVAAAAKALGVSQATVRRRIDDGSLAGFRLGCVRRVLRSELARILDEGIKP